MAKVVFNKLYASRTLAYFSTVLNIETFDQLTINVIKKFLSENEEIAQYVEQLETTKFLTDSKFTIVRSIYLYALKTFKGIAYCKTCKRILSIPQIVNNAEFCSESCKNAYSSSDDILYTFEQQTSNFLKEKEIKSLNKQKKSNQINALTNKEKALEFFMKKKENKRNESNQQVTLETLVNKTRKTTAKNKEKVKTIESDLEQTEILSEDEDTVKKLKKETALEFFKNNQSSKKKESEDTHTKFKNMLNDLNEEKQKKKLTFQEMKEKFWSDKKINKKPSLAEIMEKLKNPEN